MPFAQTVSRFFSKSFVLRVCLTSILVDTAPACLGQQKSELAAVNGLIAIIESNDAGQSMRAESLFASVPELSPVKPVATNSLALIHIQNAKYSDAWKVLTAPPNNKAPVSEAITAGKERLKLWLLLEAHATEKAEAQFKKLVTLSLGGESTSAQLTANCAVIGGIVGMQEANAETPCIQPRTLAKAKELLVAKVEGKNAILEMEEKLSEASKWGTDLASCVSDFESIGPEKADEQYRSTQAEYEKEKQEQLKLREELKLAGKEKNTLEDQRKRWIKKKNLVLEEMKRETPGKPSYPAHPGPAPSPPNRPRGRYKTDPKTQESKYVPPTTCEERDYDEKRRTFEQRSQQYHQRFANYQRDLIEYPAKMQMWEQKDNERRTALQSHIQEAQLGIATADKGLDDMQKEINRGVGKAIKENTDRLKSLERLVTISSIASKHVATKDVKDQPLFRPSNFLLLDYEEECNRLKKSLRELNGLNQIAN